VRRSAAIAGQTEEAFVYARMTTIHSPRERMDEGIAQVRKDVLPLFDETEGFRGIIGLVDRNSNSGITISLWDDEESMARSEDVGVELRRKAAEAMKAETEPMVNRYEIVLYQVPEPVTTEVG
jgi:hypothetical protein